MLSWLLQMRRVDDKWIFVVVNVVVVCDQSLADVVFGLLGNIQRVFDVLNPLFPEGQLRHLLVVFNFLLIQRCNHFQRLLYCSRGRHVQSGRGRYTESGRR